MAQNVTVTLTRRSGYQFEIDFGAALPAVFSDEPPPLGQGQGPTPNHLLLAAVANCLSASLTFALSKFKNDPGALRATARSTVDRNAQGRLRIQRIEVEIQLERPGADYEHLERILAQFEDFCTVSMSVREGIPIDVRVRDGSGAVLKG
ncbi:MAG: OsmC family protein [Tepidimonas ignava]|uniref:Peroxiredoxin, OsmC subfamily n=1 Tax=Tepidimonas ignava TaxID=114249 RepID=A0A4R3LKA0_9BURK|nr:OsmC family protein [Tepidimonas ignava]MCX7815733.1 OsmC family protein [Tepidimonas ignava]TCS98964.1 putative OsmC-like protein [Tepidimonas ignava]TSE22953.1 peroxiredoxin, OsmC subfamily [Tepidimonas ignava]